MNETESQKDVRICKRCLLREIDEAHYKETIVKYIDMIEDDARTDENMYNERLDVCRNCDKLNQGTCLASGCYVEIRAAAKRSKCPDRLW